MTALEEEIFKEDMELFVRNQHEVNLKRLKE